MAIYATTLPEYAPELPAMLGPAPEDETNVPQLLYWGEYLGNHIN
jgi:hypothetical protein